MTHKGHGGRHDWPGLGDGPYTAWGWKWLNVFVHRLPPGGAVGFKVWKVAMSIRWNGIAADGCGCSNLDGA
jgi:hypothetical protein